MKGAVVRIVTDKQYGFIRTTSQGEYFFHKSDYNGFWDDLIEDFNGKQEILVTFEPTESKKGLRASNVHRLDHPNAS